MNIIKATPKQINKYAGDATAADRHTDSILSNVSVAYMQSATNFVTSRVFPTVNVAKQSDKYYKYDKEAFFRNDSQKRADATESAGIDLGLSTDNYFADVDAVHVDVGDQEASNADESVDPFVDAAQLTMNSLLIRREIDFVTTYMSTGVWANELDLSTAAQWDDYASSDPADDIEAAKVDVWKACGMLPNKLTVDYETHSKLKNHPLILDKYKYTSSASITSQLLAQYFEVDEYLVSTAIYANNTEGATVNLQSIMGNKALLSFAPMSPSRRALSAGYIFNWSGYTGVNNMGIRTKRYYMDHLAATRIETEMSYDMKVVASEAGYLFTNTIS